MLRADGRAEGETFAVRLTASHDAGMRAVRAARKKLLLRDADVPDAEASGGRPRGRASAAAETGPQTFALRGGQASPRAKRSIMVMVREERSRQGGMSPRFIQQASASSEVSRRMVSGPSSSAKKPTARVPESPHG